MDSAPAPVPASQVTREFKYAFLMYHPTPQWGELGTRFAVALVGFPEQAGGGAAKLWLLKNRLEAVKEFGGGNHDLAVRECLSCLLEILSAYGATTEALCGVDDRVFAVLKIVRLGEFDSLQAPSLPDLPGKLGVDAIEATYNLLGSWPEGWN